MCEHLGRLPKEPDPPPLALRSISSASHLSIVLNSEVKDASDSSRAKYISYSVPASRKKDLAFIQRECTVRIELHWRLSGMHFNLPLDLKRLQ
jgi:hypothetical protein